MLEAALLDAVDDLTETVVNLLVNGDPQVRQRGFSFSNLASGFTADRWYFTQEGEPQNVIKLGIGEAAPGAAGTIKVQRPKGATSVGRMSLYQVLPTLESVKLHNTTVFTCWMKVGADWSAQDLSLEIVGGIGHDQPSDHLRRWSGESTLAQSPVMPTASMQRFSASGAIPRSVTQVAVRCSWNPRDVAGADDSITFGGMDLRPGQVEPGEMETESYDLSYAKCTAFYEELARIDGVEPVCIENLMIIPEQADGKTWGQGTLHFMPKRFYKRLVLDISKNLSTDVHFEPATQGSIYSIDGGDLQTLHRSPTRMMIRFGWSGGLPKGYMPGMVAHFATDGTAPALTPHFAVNGDL